MKRTIVLPALLAGVLFSAEGAAAQSNTRGFMLNAHVTGASLGGTPEGAELDSGAGLGAALGYGFNDLLTLYVNVDAQAFEHADGDAEDGDDGQYGGATVDLGLRVNFGNETQRLRPYLNTALTGVGFGDEVEGLELVTGGAGLTLGGGLQYFFARSLAVDGALNFSTGSLTTVEYDGQEADLDEGIGFNHTRVQLGLSWHP